MNRYDMRQFDPKSYPWNEKGKKTAVHYIVWRWIVSLLIMAGIVYMVVSTKMEMLSFSGALCACFCRIGHRISPIDCRILPVEKP